MLSSKTILIAGSLLGFLSVALGAFGAHAFKDFLSSTNRLGTYETAVHYQMSHSLALVLVGILYHIFPQQNFSWPAIFLAVGILIFSGSLYLLCATGIKWLGAITPIGGLSFLAGWLLLAWKVYKLQ
ncbi:MAG TPA: DUF423 domain-containing protein [Catalimonadaceae bacterium]|nr:DUF423 domain-containing protein [Catalimonadaceae bacterium]